MTLGEIVGSPSTGLNENISVDLVAGGEEFIHRNGLGSLGVQFVEFSTGSPRVKPLQSTVVNPE